MDRDAITANSPMIMSQAFFGKFHQFRQSIFETSRIVS